MSGSISANGRAAHWLMRNRAAQVAALAASFQPANAAMSSARSMVGARKRCIWSIAGLPSAIAATARVSAWSVYHLATRSLAPAGDPAWEIWSDFSDMLPTAKAGILGSPTRPTPRLPEGPAQPVLCSSPRCGPDAGSFHSPGTSASERTSPCETSTPQPLHVCEV